MGCYVKVLIWRLRIRGLLSGSRWLEAGPLFDNFSLEAEDVGVVKW